jgi:succinate dehydrogenase / fumarate reductase flavoprotein subunit
MEANWRNTLLVCRAQNGDETVPDIGVSREEQVAMRPDLLELFEISELEKYYTDQELAEHPERRS